MDATSGYSARFMKSLVYSGFCGVGFRVNRYFTHKDDNSLHCCVVYWILCWCFVAKCNHWMWFAFEMMRYVKIWKKNWLLKRETIFIGQTFYEGKEEEEDEEEEEGELEADCCCNKSDLLFWCDWAMSCWFVGKRKRLSFYTNYSNKLAG